MALRVNCRLDVVADNAGPPRLRRTRVRVGKRNLLVGCRVQLHLDLLEASHLFLQGRDLLLQSLRSDLRDGRLLAIRCVHRLKITSDTRLDVAHASFKRGIREVAVAMVHRLNSLPPIATKASTKRSRR
jgi:hypothetical protein